jgi:hypothetical protein
MSKKLVKVINLSKSIESDSEYETDNETETTNQNETLEPKEKSKKTLKDEGILVPPPKKKRVLSEKHKEALAKARVKAREVLKAKSDINRRRKEMKAEHMLIKKLEFERDLQQHENYKKKLILEGGFREPEAIGVKERKKRVTKERIEDEPLEDHIDEIKALEEKLSKLRTDTHARGYGKKEVKKIETPATPVESEEESEEEPPVIVKKKKVKTRTDKTTEERFKPQAPELKKHDPVIKNEDRPIVNRKIKTTNDEDIKKQIALLFPGYR